MPTDPKRSLPTGTVTFLFTDIEGSTRLLASLGDAYDALLETHGRLLGACFVTYGGMIVNTEGDAFFVVFPIATDAVRAVIDAQRALAVEAWPEGSQIRVRMGLHTGVGRLGGDDYSGLDVNRTARIAAAGHGGQVVVSDATRAILGSGLPDAGALRDLGEHQLKDIPAAEHLWQLDIDGLPTDFPPLRTQTARRGNLPVASSSLIGRDVEVDQIRTHLADRNLVTLTGPGGTGKTRLALRVAELEAEAYPDGAWFVELADATDRAAVASDIGTALGVREKPDRDFEAGLSEYLRDRRLLLVLDNFEQVIEAATLAAELLAGAPGLRMIATSRSALRIRGEQEYAVPPLDGSAASHLFATRARDVRPEFELDDENTAVVTAICHRLDGLPLAIELAAVRVRMLSPAAILDRLEKRLPMLRDGGRDRPERQRTLTGAIDWSYDLLDDIERRLFARLSVFAGGWSLESAEQVCDPTIQLGIDVFDGLSALVEKSLVTSTSVAGGEPRFAMLQVIREYALERLAEDADAEAVKRRHAEAMLALAEASEPQLVRADLRRWQLRLLQDEDNLRAALRWSIDYGEVEIGLRTAGSIWRFWQYWAKVQEGSNWLNEVLDSAAGSGTTQARARALTGLAGLLYWTGEIERADELYQQVVELRRTSADEQLLAEALSDAFWGAVGKGEMANAMARGHEALRLFEATGDEVGSANVSSWIRTMEFLGGQGGTLAEAVAVVARAVEVNRTAGLIHGASEMLALQARTERLNGRFEDARRHLREALSIFYELGNFGRLPGVFKVFAALELATGHPERAVRLGAAAARYMEEIGGQVSDRLLRAGNPVEEARADLTDAQHAHELELGASMSIKEAVDFALAG